MKKYSPSHRQFIENCEDILSKQSYVSINESALKAFAKTLKASDFIPDWKDYISPAANDAEHYDFARAFYELAMITAQNGGYIYADETGAAQKWGKDGSGAKAMVEKMAEIRAAKALPFYDITPAEVGGKLSPLLAGVPFAEKRLAIFKEFASVENHGKMAKLLDSAFDGTAYKFDMSFVKKLAAIFPEGLGNDPFFKKATLTALMAAGNAHHRGIKVDVADLAVAADYILPQVLNADHVGILSFNADLQETLEKRQLLPEDSNKVEALRAAAVVVCEKLSKLSGLTAQDIDASLWLAGRKLQNARPHMMCSTTWF